MLVRTIYLGTPLISCFILYANSQMNKQTITLNQEKQKDDQTNQLNVFGQPLQLCSKNPLTGFYRSGYCETGPNDVGTHVVCAQVNEQFLEFTKSRGNDLSTPRGASFPGLKPGDKWCLCAMRWKEAYNSRVFVPVDVQATNLVALDYVTLQQMQTPLI